MKLPILALTLSLLPTVAITDDALSDAELARRLVAKGEILPLAEVLDIVDQHYPGHVIELELEYEDSILVYEIELITDDGRLIEIELDAKTGEILDEDEADD